jgi:hypothetical protein
MEKRAGHGKDRGILVSLLLVEFNDGADTKPVSLLKVKFHNL